MRRLCVGDIHGCYDKLMRTLDLCKFSDSDILYSVGDFTDRGEQNVKVIDFLMSLKNFKPVCGNHDLWNYEYLSRTMSREALLCWVGWNGGKKTFREEEKQSQEWKKSVAAWLADIPYRLDLGDRIIIHSPCHSKTYQWVDAPLDEITMDTLKMSNLIRDEVYDDIVWSRSIIPACRGYQPIGEKELKEADIKYYREYCDPVYSGDKIYIIGHTPLDHPFYDKELGIVGIDTGAFCNEEEYGVDGALTVIDIDTFEYWQSNNNMGSLS